MKLSYTYILLIMINLLIFGQNGNLIWEDNFNDGQPDLTRWSYETGTGVNGDRGTGQIDRAKSRKENVSFRDNIPGAEDGCLAITKRKEFYISEVSHVSVKISNLPGELTATLVEKIQFPGSYEVTFDASGLSSGLYFYTMRAGNFVIAKKNAFSKITL